MQHPGPLPADKQSLIFLIGFMGTGKTHWGKIWAQEVGYDFVDLDETIEAQQCRSVAEIFVASGEEYFRKLEAKELRRLGTHKNVIVACGGGTPCFFDNMDWMTKYGTTIWLQATPAVIQQNISRQPGTRPLLSAMNEGDMLAFIERKLEERAPFYKRAEVIASVESLEKDFILKKILQSK